MSRSSRMAIVERRRTVVASMLLTLERPTVRRIAEAMGELDPPVKAAKTTVAKDIQAIREEWAVARHADADEWVARELAAIEKVEAEAWEALEASKGDVSRRSAHLVSPHWVGGGGPGADGVGGEHGPGDDGPGGRWVGGDDGDGDGDLRMVESWDYTSEQTANPKYMEIIIRCGERKAKLLGYDSPDKLDVRFKDGAGFVLNTSGQPLVDDVVDAEVLEGDDGELDVGGGLLEAGEDVS